MQPTAPMLSNNARISHIRKFTMVPPERGVRLSLVSIEEPPQRLGEWTREQCIDNGVTAEDVDARVNEHVQEVERDLSFTLAWIADDGALVVSKRLNGKFRPDVAMDDVDREKLEALGINGTRQGEDIQRQRAFEGLLRLMLSDNQTRAMTAQSREERAEQRAMEREERTEKRQERQMALYEKLIETMGTQLIETQKHSHAAHMELDKQRAQHRMQIEKMANEYIPADVEGAERSEQISKVWDMLNMALPHILKGLVGMMQPKVPENVNATPPSAG